ncbi:MAG TPA: NTP transferase domain-containing protein [Sumerlaeia bacterium]|nr:NTP transferase domain-containing protein [Sumerlaeia bacterium]
MQPRFKTWVINEEGRNIIGDGRYRLLEAIRDLGSLSQAAKLLRMSYRKAWGDVRKLETMLGAAVIERRRGGRRGGGSASLTPVGLEALERYRAFRHEVEAAVEGAFQKHLAALTRPETENGSPPPDRDACAPSLDDGSSAAPTERAGGAPDPSQIGTPHADPRRAARTAIILAGGESSRMGTDKALLRVRSRDRSSGEETGDLTIVERLRDALSPLCGEILLSSNSPERHGFLGLPIVPDEERGQGPLMGLYSALRASSSAVNFVVGCDVPELDAAFARRLFEIAESTNCDAVVPVTTQGRLEPLMAVYRKDLAGPMGRCLGEGVRRMRDFLSRCRVETLPLDDAPWRRNLNTPEDVEAYRRGP